MKTEEQQFHCLLSDLHVTDYTFELHEDGERRYVLAVGATKIGGFRWNDVPTAYKFTRDGAFIGSVRIITATREDNYTGRTIHSYPEGSQA